MDYSYSESVTVGLNDISSLDINSPRLLMPLTEVETRRNGYEVHQQTGTVQIQLDRPKKGNSLSLSMAENLKRLFQNLSTQHSVHRIILTGKGKYFCTGMDLSEELSECATQRCLALQGLFGAIDACTKTTVAVINGPAFGGGVGLAFACDIRIAVSTSFFCLSEVKLGLCPATVSKFIIREWGVGLARMAMLTARKIEPQTLHNVGALHAVASDEETLKLVTKHFLDELRHAAPQASAWCKVITRETCSESNDLDQLVRQIFEAMVATGSESEYGVAQFRVGCKNICWEEVE
ncbi:enoyl hydratase isomerase family [Fusarium phyllophilum]|uniref:Enoyl hydratase isomerase family n=1 Tax=Fusarium phyllophilum TaxID=47803 RepID=A0A8H5IDZ0_9HYPO|nr:enoyl hydratase isomerase family [Fusarium phyllophilum]